MPKPDLVIIGAGIVGLSIARQILMSRPGCQLLIMDKESDVGAHSSGRNSGVLHAGFYYTANSLKAQFTANGNREMKQYCRDKSLAINTCGKLVVAMDDQELVMLQELQRRGERNGSNVRLISLEEARTMEPGVFSHRQALHSPDTASIDPLEVLNSIKSDLAGQGVEFRFNTRFLGRTGTVLRTTSGEIDSPLTVNCSGLYADKVAAAWGIGTRYTMIPFKGLYLKYARNKTDVRINIYPVPNLKNPFLGVHYTKTVDGTIKIGPTAIPAFWRENYTWHNRFQPGESLDILAEEARLFTANSFGFRDLAFEEMRKYDRNYFISLATRLVPTVDPAGFGDFTKPGIRAQLLDRTTRALVQDFVVERGEHSVHVLNAVSPAFTCAFPFARHVCEQFVFDH